MGRTTWIVKACREKLENDREDKTAILLKELLQAEQTEPRAETRTNGEHNGLTAIEN